MNKKNYQLKILQLTDLHWSQDYLVNKNSKKLIAKIVLGYRPDLVIITGNLINKNCFTNPKQALDDLIKTFDNLRIPWTFVFGNQERNYDDFNIIEQSKYLSKNSRYLLFNDYKINDRVGNYKLVIPTKKVYVNIFMLDSGYHEMYENSPSFSWITDEQIKWVDDEINSLQSKNDRDSIYLFFQHLPIPEYDSLLSKKISGEKNEIVSCPKFNSNFYSYLKNKLPKNKKFMFVGNNHYNDYIINDDDFILSYGRLTGNYNYNPTLPYEDKINHNSNNVNVEYPKGARFFELKSDFIMVGKILEPFRKITEFTSYL